MKENEGELIVKYANPIFNPNKASQIERIKKFIDKNQGNVFIKDLQNLI